MSTRLLSSAVLALALSAGAAAAGDQDRTGRRAPETTGSVRGETEAPFLFGVPQQNPGALLPRGRSTFNADTARARHYER